MNPATEGHHALSPVPGTEESTPSSYDAIPYSINSFPQTRPDRLAAIAKLFGLTPASPDRCRVLELGCASGGNLLPLAVAFPESHFVGIDLSSRQVADGQAVVRELGLRNLDLRPLSILDVGAEFGEFDYILAHGVYSWVPPEVQDKILNICQRNLAPTGIAYVSYNTLPGWHARGAIREMLWYHTGHLHDPAERIREARSLLDFLANSVGQGDGGYGGLLRQELSLLRQTPDTYVLHEHLDDFNEPLYFHQFVERAAQNELQYLGEAQLQTMVAGRFGEEAEKKLREISPDILHMEQYMDFLRNRMFRQTLLCHANLHLEHSLKSEAVRTFCIGSAMRPVATEIDETSQQLEEFTVGGSATFNTHDPLMKAALLILREKWPLALPYQDLLNAAIDRLRTRSYEIHPGSTDELPRRLLHCYTCNMVEFSQSKPSFVGHVSDHPIASSYARLRARTGGKITNFRLETVMLGEPSRLLLTHLDGTRDRTSLVNLMQGWLEKSSPTTNTGERSTRFVEQALQGFARSALLIG